MPNDVEARLLDVVTEVHELTALPRIGHHQEDLRTPVLDMGFAGVQHQQVLTHLRGKSYLIY